MAEVLFASQPDAPLDVPQGPELDGLKDGPRAPVLDASQNDPPDARTEPA